MLRDLLDLFSEGAQGALRLRVEGRSQATVITVSARPESAFLKPQGPRSGLNAIIGKWPGDETEEEFLAALAELS